MNFDPVWIYLFLGFAHWSAHVISCPGCQETVSRNTSFLLEGFTKVFGWPIHLAMYLLDRFHPSRTGLTHAEVEAHVRRETKRILDNADGGMFVEMSQKENESDEEFQERIKQTMVGIAQGAAASRTKGEGNGPETASDSKKT